MTRADQPDDAALVAYLDGELSPAESVRVGQLIATDALLAARVAHLMKGGRPFREAFQPLLDDAPLGRLEAMLDAVSGSPTEAKPQRTGMWWRASLSWPALAAAAAVLVFLGAGLERVALEPFGTTSSAPSTQQEASDDWRRAVAQYLSLYTRETLAGIGEAASPTAPQLAAVGQRLGLVLTPERVDFADLPLKRADLYDYDGNALAFLAYLDPKDGPVALCITEGRPGSEAQRTERRRGMNVVYWSQGRHGFMLIGHADPARLQALASAVASRFEPKSDGHG